MKTKDLIKLLKQNGWQFKRRGLKQTRYRLVIIYTV